MRRIDIAIIVTLLVVIVSAVSILLYLARPGPLDHLPVQKATLTDTALSLHVPISSEARSRGLGGIEQLPPDHGMLFYMPYTDHPSIWMKDMLIPIDILWLDSERRVVHMELSVAPDTYPQVFRNPIGTSAQYVLELGAEQAKQLGISLGSELVLSEPIIEHLRR